MKQKGLFSNKGKEFKKVKEILCQLNEILENIYKTPDLGNKVDPLEELLYLNITQRTRIDLAKQVFDEFKIHFYPWRKALFPANQNKLRKILSKGGRGNLRYRAVTEILSEIKQREGKLSLGFLRKLSLDEAKKYLLSLPWIGEKTAYCVLMYSLNHPVFPVDSNIFRIFRRSKILENVHVSLDGDEHRVAQKKIAPLIPKEIIYSLHVNMVVHGKKVCIEKNPGCYDCGINLFCEYYRDSKFNDGLKFELRMVDLFSGAGGISYGFALAGLRPILAVDNFKPACETYRLNIPWISEKLVINNDIREISDQEILKHTNEERIDILVAGVPCKGFSKVGLKSKPLLRKERPPEKDEANKLFMEVIRWTEILKPSIVLLENVPDMSSSKICYKDSNIDVKDLLEKNFAKLNYTTTKAVYLNSANFGVPQIRKRLFFIASKNHIVPKELDSELIKFFKEINDSEDIRNTLPLKIALQGLPSYNSGEGENITNPSNNYPNNQSLKSMYEKFVFNNPFIVFNHIARNHNEDDMLIISSLKTGETYKKLVHRKPQVIKNRKRKVYSLENFHDKFFRLDPDKPSRTIVSHLSKDGNSFIHPYENRSITVREAARIQSFPDSFIFTGSRTAQFIQVGNAVPPLLSHFLGLFFYKLLKNNVAK